jgi:DNA-binding transcriptional LysR family regulator
MRVTLDSEALRTFIEIHRRGGVSAAAEALGRTQPAISRRLAQLEEGLATRLFDRVSGGMVLSQAGEALLPYAERVLAALEDAHEAVASLREGRGGKVSLAAVGTLAGAGLTSALRAFAAEFPRVELSLQTASSAGVSDLVRRGAVTLGLRYFDDGDPELLSLLAPPERLAVVCSPSHPLAERRIDSLRELSREPWLAFPIDHTRLEVWPETIFAQFIVRGVPGIQWSAVDSLTAQKRLIEAGFGIALMPENAVAEELAAGSLSVIHIDDLDVANPVFAIARRDGYLNAAAKGLLRLLTRGGAESAGRRRLAARIE